MERDKSGNAHAIGVGYSLACSKVLGRTSVLARRRAHSNGFFLGDYRYNPSIMEQTLIFSGLPSFPGRNFWKGERTAFLIFGSQYSLPIRAYYTLPEVLGIAAVDRLYPLKPKNPILGSEPFFSLIAPESASVSGLSTQIREGRYTMMEIICCSRSTAPLLQFISYSLFAGCLRKAGWERYVLKNVQSTKYHVQSTKYQVARDRRLGKRGFDSSHTERRRSVSVTNTALPSSVSRLPA